MQPALRLAHILFGREIYKEDASRKIDINKDATNICRKTTCTHRNCFCNHGHPIFLRHEEGHTCVSNSQIKN